jgi:nucleoside-diphosphate-sugar epimerase
VDVIIKSLASENARGQIINIGSGKPKKLRNIIEHVCKISNGGYPQFGKIKLRKDEILRIYPSIKKAENLINWKPRMSFEKGIKDTIKSY